MGNARLKPQQETFSRSVIRWPWDVKESRFSSLIQVSQILAAGADGGEEALEKILEAALTLLKARRGFIMLTDSHTGKLSIKYFKGMPASVAGEVSLEIGEGISGFVAQKGRPLLVDNLQTYRSFRKTPASRFESEAFFSIPIVSAPLNFAGETMGVLNVSDTQHAESFTTEDLALLSVLATEAAMILACRSCGMSSPNRSFSWALSRIQNSLSVISGHAQYLVRHIPEECKAAEVLKKILDQTEQVCGILKQIPKGK